MRPFEILEHTADIGIRAFGKTLPDLFANAAFALESIALELEFVKSRERYPITASGEDRESLLVNWLNEVIYYLDGKRIALARFEIDTLNGESIAAHAWGEPCDTERHRSRLVVKAATYHQLRIVEQDGGWIAEVYFDI